MSENQNGRDVGTKGTNGKDRHVYEGPTKRSADVNDFVTLEAESAKAHEEVARLKAMLKIVLKREFQWLAKIKKLEAVERLLEESAEDVAAYVTARDLAASAKNGDPKSGFTPKTPIHVIDAGLDWIRLAVRIANRAASAIAEIERS